MQNGLREHWDAATREEMRQKRMESRPNGLRILLRGPRRCRARRGLGRYGRWEWRLDNFERGLARVRRQREKDADRDATEGLSGRWKEKIGDALVGGEVILVSC